MQYFKMTAFPATWFAALVLFAGCSRSPEKPARAYPGLTPAPVLTQVTTLQNQTATEEVMATVRPRLSATLESKIPGFVVRMNVVPGQTVSNGECLVVLDSAEIKSRLDQSNAALRQAAEDWKRVSGLYGQESATRADYDAAKARHEMAEAAAAESQAMLGYCRVLAPFDGVITSKPADVGDLAMPGKPLLQMEGRQSMRLEADVPESLVGNLAMGDELTASIPSVTNELSAAVAEISPAADSSTRSFLVKLDFPAMKGLRSGQFARVAIPSGEISGIFVPETAVVERGQMVMVFVAHNGRAWMRLVRTGPVFHQRVQVLSGLNPGETIVTGGADHLEDGQPIIIQP